jgi:hypothetical protein
VTRRTSASVAGYAFLLYIAFGITSMILFSKATGNAPDVAAKLASIAQHAANIRVSSVLTLFCGFAAIVLAVTLYAITRDQDPDVAMLGLACRVAEGVFGGLAIKRSQELLWLATATGADAPEAQAVSALGGYLLMNTQSAAAMFFAVGSTCFCWLLLRGRMIPIALAWLGFLASVLWVVGGSLRLVEVLPRSFDMAVWIPMAAFEIPFALWLIFKGVNAPLRTRATPEAVIAAS